MGVLLLIATSAWAQEADTLLLTTAERARRQHFLDSIRQLPDFELHYPLTPHTELPSAQRTSPPYHTVRFSTTRRLLPARVYVLNNISLQIGGYVNLTNGQAWLFGPYPAGYLDARTLSVPLPR